MVAKSCASAILEPGQQLVMTFEGEPGAFSVTYWTEYGGGFEVPAPLKLCAEGRGPAYSLEDAVQRFANAARGGSTILALVANADLGILNPEIVFDASSERDQHEFLQIISPEHPLRAVPNRRVNVEDATSVSKALSAHPEILRLRRAMAQYSIALGLWNPGHEIQCLAHLYMGIEALTKAHLRQHLADHGLNEDQLVKEWKIDRKRLDAEVRYRLLFHEDRDAYTKAKAVSDGLEHGYSEYGEMRLPAREVIVRTAHHLRRSIVDMLKLDDELRVRLQSIGEPRGPIILVRYLRGILSGQADNLPAADQRYPIMEWRGGLNTVTQGADGRYSFTTNEAFTPKLGEGVSFSSIRFEIWDGSSIKEMPAPVPASESDS